MKKTTFITFVAAFLAAFASPTRSTIAGRSIIGGNNGNVEPEYISDGLLFFGEKISPPSSGAQRIQIGNLDTSAGFTVEVYGRPVATSDGCMLSISRNYNATGFAACWWIRGDRINVRFYNQEFFTGIYNNTIAHFAYTCDSEKNFVGYVDGKAFIEKSVPLSEIVNPSTYIVGVAGCYCDIMCIRIYDRVLSKEEIAYNYSVDLWRYMK